MHIFPCLRAWRLALVLLCGGLATGCAFRQFVVFVYGTIPAGELPGRVRNEFKKDFPGDQIEKVETESFRGETQQYRIWHRSPDGQHESVIYDRSGKRIASPGNFPLEPKPMPGRPPLRIAAR